MTTVPYAVVDRFHSILMDDDNFKEAVMRAAEETVRYYAGGEALTEADYELAQDLFTRVSVA